MTNPIPFLQRSYQRIFLIFGGLLVLITLIRGFSFQREYPVSLDYIVIGLMLLLVPISSYGFTAWMKKKAVGITIAEKLSYYRSGYQWKLWSSSLLMLVSLAFYFATGSHNHIFVFFMVLIHALLEYPTERKLIDQLALSDKDIQKLDLKVVKQEK
ncbi:MAG: hypothetical protein LAT68_15510 [Cyclobacteriaceae bacterium]|nr:hypothetical protein [Cyclobacteriaceae bacterium]MCH8517729.1 hypothetical protein [Cyclobacteriaceae bacterium]